MRKDEENKQNNRQQNSENRQRAKCVEDNFSKGNRDSLQHKCNVFLIISTFAKIFLSLRT